MTAGLRCPAWSRITLALLALLMTLQLGGCSSPQQPTWAIALHGGAGVIDRDTPAALRAQYTHSLAEALEQGRAILASGGTALDAVQTVVTRLEDDPKFNAGRGAVYTAAGTHELDASIMDGRNLACGAVAGVTTVQNPIGLARLVMERTPHVLLIGQGAEQFATEVGVTRVENTWFDTEHRRKAFEKWRALRPQAAAHPRDLPERARGTVGAVALDQQGNLAAATSTGGMTGKRAGRVGDSPIIGAGTYADNQTCAVSCTGTGEEFIRHGVAREIAARMRLQKRSVKAAADELVFGILKPDDGGLIAISRTGEIAMPYSSDGMFRGAADASGRFEVFIWQQPEPISSRPSEARP